MFIGRYDGTLQWGRGFAATEGRQPLLTLGDSERLQWGRGFAATEGGHPERSAGRAVAGFNGAVASQPRKVPV